MGKEIKVEAVWTFYVDTEGLDPEHIDLKELALDFTKREFTELLNNRNVHPKDFEFRISKDEE